MAIIDPPFSILDLADARASPLRSFEQLQTKSKEYSKGENK